MKPKNGKKSIRKLSFRSWKSFAEQFGLSIGEGRRVVTLGDKKNERFNVDAETKRMISSIKSDAMFAGNPLGRNTGKGFIPSLWSIDMAAQSDMAKKITLDKRSAWLFLCGRDIFASSLEDERPEKDYVFPMNEQGENLGIGFFDGKMIINLMDKGDFLRREG
ncbi:MAG: hypothetical protein ACLFNK_04900 [Candidatus Woesearchaeota archaeon]